MSRRQGKRLAVGPAYVVRPIEKFGHHEDTLGFCHTDFPDGTTTMTDLVSAIRGRRTAARDGRPGGASLP